MRLLVLVPCFIIIIFQKCGCDDIDDSAEDYEDLKNNLIGIERVSNNINVTLVQVCLTIDGEKVLKLEHRLSIIRAYPNIEIQFKKVKECKLLKHSQYTMAVITPEPLYETDLEIPMYFYEESYHSPVFKQDFTNSVVPVSSWKPLQYVYSSFLESNSWLRVLILSDNSASSIEFEELLVKQLKKKSILYKVQRCDVNDCESRLQAIAKFIKTSQINIIIVNIDSSNVKLLIKTAYKYGLWSTNGYVWITQEVQTYLEDKKFRGEIFSVSLAPKIWKTEAYSKLQSIADHPQVSSILQGLLLVSKAEQYTRAMRNSEITRQYLYKSFGAYWHNFVNPGSYQGYVREVSADNTNVISIADVDDKGIISSQQKIDLSKRFSDGADCSLMKSTDIMEPCNDTLIVILIIVWLTITATGLLFGFLLRQYIAEHCRR